MKETIGKGEKCVDIQLAVDMLYYATVPDAYDVALLLTGDKDFLPAVVRCRQKGRRVGLVSMRSGATIAFEETPNLKDYDTIWLEDYVDQFVTKIDFDDRKEFAPRTGRTSPISEYTMNKVIVDFLCNSKQLRVSSRDVGRYLKELEVGGLSILDEIKRVYGGLYQFLILSQIYIVESDTRRQVKAFWISQIPDAEVKARMEELSQQRDLTDDETNFLKEFEESQQEIDMDKLYEFTINDQDPGYDPEEVARGPNISADGTINVESEKKDYEKCTVDELKNICRENGLKVTGKKAELIERIEEYMVEEEKKKQKELEEADPGTRLQMMVTEYLHAAGGEASSRDIGRYLAANSASKQRLERDNSGASRISALTELKEIYGTLLKFVFQTPYFQKDDFPSNAPPSVRNGPRSITFYVSIDKDAMRELEESQSSTISN